MVHDALGMLGIDETDGGITEIDGFGDHVVGAEMNESPMPSEAGVNEAAENKSLVRSRGNEDKLKPEAAVEGDESAMNKLMMLAAVGDIVPVVMVDVEGNDVSMVASAVVAAGQNVGCCLLYTSDAADE